MTCTTWFWRYGIRLSWFWRYGINVKRTITDVEIARVFRFVQAFPDEAIFVTLSQQLSGLHFHMLLRMPWLPSTMRADAIAAIFEKPKVRSPGR